MPKAEKKATKKTDKKADKKEKKPKKTAAEPAAPAPAPAPAPASEAAPAPSPFPAATPTYPHKPPGTWEDVFYSSLYHSLPPPPAGAVAPPPVYHSFTRDLSGVYHSRYGSMAAIDAQLISKREAILQQMARVQAQMDAVAGARRSIERETMADADAIIGRLRATEAMKSSMLAHALECLRGDVASIDAFHSRFSQFWPQVPAARQPPGVPPPPELHEGPERAMAFLHGFPELSGEADRLLSKPLATTIDVRHDDFERETAVRQECLKRYEGMVELLAAKDKIIWKLLQEREGAAADVEALSKASTTEMDEWKGLTDRLTAELQRFKMVCAYCAVRLSDTTVNSDCSVNTPANATRRTCIPVDTSGPDAARGTRRHYFVKVADRGAP